MSQSIEAAFETILKGGKPESIPSRRAHPRYSASYPILVRRGSDPSAVIGGVTINICRSGMLARLEGKIAPGASCRITFLPWDRYRPELVECPHCQSEFPILELPEQPVRGTVVRLEREEEGEVVAAILFEEPLDSVSEPEGPRPA